MAKAKLQLRDDAHLILEVHKKGHVSVQEFFQGYPRPPTVMSAVKAYKLGKWLTQHAGAVEGGRYDPVIERRRER